MLVASILSNRAWFNSWRKHVALVHYSTSSKFSLRFFFCVNNYELRHLNIWSMFPTLPSEEKKALVFVNNFELLCGMYMWFYPNPLYLDLDIFLILLDMQSLLWEKLGLQSWFILIQPINLSILLSVKGICRLT